MYALVKYQDDPKKRYIVDTNEIKDFNVEKFSKTRTYDVYWTGNPSRSEDGGNGYYKAQVLLVPETREAIEDETTNKRVVVPPLNHSDTASSDQGRQRKTKQIEKKKTIQQASTKAKALRSIIDEQITKKAGKPLRIDVSSDSSDEELLPSKEIQESRRRHNTLLSVLDGERTANLHLEEENERLQTENQKLKRMNENLQKALCAKVFELEAKAVVQTQTEERCLPVVTGGMGSDLPTEVNPGHQPEPTLPSISGTGQEAGNNANNLEKENSTTYPVVEDDQARITPTVSISAQTWSLIQNAKSDSLFCKEMAVAIWGAKELSLRSVTGLPCNVRRGVNEAGDFIPNIPKPRLSPHKIDAITFSMDCRLRKRGLSNDERSLGLKKIKKYLNEKINDLRRK